MVHLDVEVNHQYIKHAVYLKSLALSNTIFIGARTYKVIYNIITAVYPENEPPPTPPLLSLRDWKWWVKTFCLPKTLGELFVDLPDQLVSGTAK